MFPIKISRRATVALECNIVVPEFRGLFGMRQIPEGEWWGGMYEFGGSEDTKSSVLLGKFRHSVTHHRLAVSVSLLSVKSKFLRLKWYAPVDLEDLPMPSHQRRAAQMAILALPQKATNSTGKTTAPVASKK